MAKKQVEQYVDVARAAVRAAAIGKPVIAFSHLSGGLDQTIKGILDQGKRPISAGDSGKSSCHSTSGQSTENFLRSRKEEEGGAFYRLHRNLKEMVQKLKGQSDVSFPTGKVKRS